MLPLPDLIHIRLFLDIVHNKSLSRGAVLNGMSQSAASQHILDLEKKLGITLLDRSTRPFAVTPAGKLYCDLCRDLVRRNEEFEADLNRMQTEVEGTVRLACIYSVGLSEMSRLKGEYSRRYPNTALQVEYLRPDKVYEAVASERADLGLVSYPEPTRDISVLPWRKEEMAVVAAYSHPLAGNWRLHATALEGRDFIAFDEELPIRRDIDRYLREHGVTIKIALHFDNIQMIKEAVAVGSGVSILPERVVRTDVEQGRLAAMFLNPRLFRPLGIIHYKRKKFTRAGQSFLQLLQEDPAAPAPRGTKAVDPVEV